MAIGDRVRQGIQQWVQDATEDAQNLINMVVHRIQYGSPPLIDPSEDAMVSTRAALDAKQERIRRRRMLLGLPYEPWNGVGGKGGK